MIGILGWIGNGFFMGGTYAFGKKSVSGFYLNIIGNFLYTWQSVLLNNSSLIWLSFILICLNCKGILEWRQRSYLILS